MSNENDLIKKAIESDDFDFLDIDSLGSIDDEKDQGDTAPVSSNDRGESTLGDLIAASTRNDGAKSSKLAGLKGKINVKGGFGKLKNSFMERFQEDDMGQWDDLASDGNLSIDDFLKKDSVEKTESKTEEEPVVANTVIVETPVVPTTAVSSIVSETSASIAADEPLETAEIPSSSAIIESLADSSASIDVSTDDLGIEFFDLDSIDSISDIAQSTNTNDLAASIAASLTTKTTEPTDIVTTSIDDIMLDFDASKDETVALDKVDQEDESSADTVIDMSDAEENFITRRIHTLKDKVSDIDKDEVIANAKEFASNTKEKTLELIARIKGEKDLALNDDGTNKDRAKEGFGVWSDDDDEETKRRKRAERKRQEHIKLIKIGGIALALIILIILISSCEKGKNKDQQNTENTTTTQKENTFPDMTPEEEEGISNNTVSKNNLSVSENAAQMTDDTKNEILDGEIALKISNMTLEQKVAQLFFVTPEILMDSRKDITAAGSDMGLALVKYPVGGVLLTDKNFQDADGLVNMSSYVASATNHLAFIAVEETGDDESALTLAEILSTEAMSQPEVGESDDTSNAYLAAVNISKVFRRYDINMVFGPMTDVAYKDNAVNASQSFGSKSAFVKDCVRFTVHAYEDEGINCCAMSFPGYGDITSTTSAVPVSHRTKSDVENNEKAMYKDAIYTGVDIITVSAVKYDKIDSANPACMSTTFVQDMIRTDLKYDGIVMSDYLNSKWMTSTYTSKDAAVKCLQAGCDMLLCPADLEEAYYGVLDAVDEGTLTEEQIDASLYRIYRVKMAGQLNYGMYY